MCPGGKSSQEGYAWQQERLLRGGGWSSVQGKRQIQGNGFRVERWRLGSLRGGGGEKGFSAFWQSDNSKSTRERGNLLPGVSFLT